MRKGVVRAALAAVVGVMAAMTGSAALGQYKEPPEAIRRVLDTPPTPGVSIDPTNTVIAFLHRTALPPVADLAAPMLRLGGSRINPDTNGPHGPIRTIGVSLRRFEGGPEVRLELPENAKLGGVSWSADGAWMVMTNTTERGIELLGASVEEAMRTGKVRRIVSGREGGAWLNAASGGTVSWMPDQRSVLVRLIPAARGAMPQEPRRPDGPVIQEADGKPAPVRTFQDLLTNRHDEAVFDHVMTAQLAVVNLETGESRLVGGPGIYAGTSVSPSGQYLLVGQVVRPYSYQVPWSSFPQRWEVWDMASGSVVRHLTDVPMRDRVPIQGVQTGPRGIDWMESREATLLWVEALDGGDPRAKVEHRDRLMMLAAPFEGEAREVMKVQHRFSGVSWMEGGSESRSEGMLSEFDRDRRWTRTWMVTLDGAGSVVGEPRVVFDRSVNDLYNDPGSPLTDRQRNGVSLIRVEGEGEGRFVYLTGRGATPQGDRPFLDRMVLGSFSTERLWRCEGENFESVIDVMRGGSTDKPRVITSYEDKTTPPNVIVHDLSSGARQAVTTFTDPLPELRQIRKQILTYTRDDGTPLSGTLYLPPGYVEGTKLPLLVWAYPNEVSDASTAGQVAGSEYRFTQIGGSSQLFMLLAGYAVLDDASMPVIGDAETMNDTFVHQIVANAQAAIDAVVALGVADKERVAVAGHSYGAFMTANLLAHAPEGMFRAGIARSGAYNRTLTPFGFQAERRSFWEAREVYMNLSPFTYADKIKTPILLIHGQVDNNPGTFPVQSERLFQAIRGTGGTARLVMLPHESHGYVARESVGHVLAEMVEWMDRYVKGETRSGSAE